MKTFVNAMRKLSTIKPSHSNLLRDLKWLANDTKTRRDMKKCILSGHKIVNEYLQTGKTVHQLFMTKEYKEKHASSIQGNQNIQDNNTIMLHEGMIEKVTGEARSEGILAVIPFSPTNLLRMQQFNRILYPIGLKDPKNLGALIRSAHALNYKVYLKDCCCPFSIEAIRAARGVHLIHDNVLINTDIDKYQLIAAELPSKIMQKRQFQSDSMCNDGRIFPLIMTNEIYTPFAVVVGNESHGLPKNLDANVYVGIETIEGSSLNVSMAASIIMFTLSAIIEKNGK